MLPNFPISNPVSDHSRIPGFKRTKMETEEASLGSKAEGGTCPISQPSPRTVRSGNNEESRLKAGRSGSQAQYRM